ncbi:aspartate kinase [Candidatus Termititenax aidoneus]|uniref:Aspartokinase n=1 Tax=Termititenax aidoneus TaxID=2218524 RepID=A0A388TBL8_TERA1|nr:aspartate kinase [Candidatus Termititenax aidoneus]
MVLLVQKYGGTSVGAIAKIQNVAKKVLAAQAAGNQLVVVVSAMGPTTDVLIAKIKELTAAADPREYDALVSIGENESAALLAQAIIAQGGQAVSLTGWQVGIRTEDQHNKCKIINVDTRRIKQELRAGKIAVITGFQGLNSRGDVTTIGRGGSDTSAVVIASALGADVCEIYTDVDGVYTTDPRLLPEARLLEAISHEEMLEMASLGAGVLHPRAVECAKVNDMTIAVKHSHKTGKGTLITMAGEKLNTVSGVAADDDVAKIGLLHVPDVPGMAAELFGALAAAKINVDVIVQSIHEEAKKNDISFTVNNEDYARALKLTEEKARGWDGCRVAGNTDVAKVSVVGIGMASAPGVAARMFSALGREKINIQMISTSEIKISCIIEKKELKRAVKSIHSEFELDK